VSVCIEANREPTGGARAGGCKKEIGHKGASSGHNFPEGGHCRNTVVTLGPGFGRSGSK